MTKLDKKYWFVFPVLVLGSLVIVSIIENRPINFVLDDAYITIANAHILVQGGTDSFGNRVPTGATSPVHLAVLALLGHAMDLRLASFGLSLSFAALFATGLWMLLLRVTKSYFVAACGTVLGLVGGYSWAMLLNGLETGMAMAAVTWALWCSQERRDTILAVIVGFLPFIRPELAALSVFLLVSLLWRARHEKARLALLLCIALIVGSVLALAALGLTGHLLSPTAAAKQFFFDEQPLSFGRRLALTMSAVIASPIAVPLFGLVFLPALRDGWAFLCFVFAFLVVFAEQLPVALFHNDFRYLYPMLPLGIAGWGVVFGRLPKLKLMSIAALAVLATFPAQGWRFYRESIDFYAAQEEVAIWVEVNIPSRARILIHDAGYVPWHVRFVAEPSRDFELVDVVGLKTPGAMRAHEELTFPSHGTERGAAIARIAREADAQYAIILDRPFWADIEGNLRQAGWRIEMVFANPAGYQVFKIILPAD